MYYVSGKILHKYFHDDDDNDDVNMVHIFAMQGLERIIGLLFMCLEFELTFIYDKLFYLNVSLPSVLFFFIKVAFS